MNTTLNRSSRVARAAVLPLLASATLGLTACGGGSDTTTNAAAGTTTGAAAQQQQGYGQAGGGRGGFGGQTQEERAKLQACLKKEGVSLPAGRGGPGGAPGTGTNGQPPTQTDGTPPAGGNGAPPAGGAPGGGLPGGGGAGGGRGQGMTAAERTKFQAALKTCGVSTPARGAGQGQRQGRPDVNDAAYRKSIEAYVVCVKKNGFDLPKPDFSGDGPIFDPKKVDQTDATFKKASAACQSTLQRGRTGGTAGGSSSGSGSGTTTSGASGATT